MLLCCQTHHYLEDFQEATCRKSKRDGSVAIFESWAIDLFSVVEERTKGHRALEVASDDGAISRKGRSFAWSCCTRLTRSPRTPG